MDSNYGISVSLDGKTLIIKIPIKTVVQEVQADIDIGSLTSKEKIVFGFLREGFYHKEIADKMNLSMSSIKKHAMAINRKLGVMRFGRPQYYKQNLLKPVLVKVAK